MKELESNLFEERIKAIKGASCLLPERKHNGELDIEKFGFKFCHNLKKCVVINKKGVLHGTLPEQCPI